MNWIIINYSWHWAFGALGVVGILWAAVWLILGREGPLGEQPGADRSSPKVPYATLLMAPTFVGCCAATFGLARGAAGAGLGH